MKTVSLSGAALVGLFLFNDSHDQTDGRTVGLQLGALPVEHRHQDGGLAHAVVLAAAGRGAAGLHQELRVTLHGLHLESGEKTELMSRRFQSAEGKMIDECGLTQEGRVSVTERETLVPRNAKGRKHVEPLVQERLQAGS